MDFEALYAWSKSERERERGYNKDDYAFKIVLTKLTTLTNQASRSCVCNPEKGTKSPHMNR